MIYDRIHGYGYINSKNILLNTECDFFVKKEINKEGVVKEFYKIRNVCVVLYGDRYRFQGSLATFFYGNNLKTLNRYELLEAISLFKMITGICLKNAIVTRLEISGTLTVSNSPNSYFPFLGELTGQRRNENKNSLYYTNSSRQTKFYDKRKELLSMNGGNYNWLAQDLLRYELVYSGSWLRYISKKYFNRKGIVLEDLTCIDIADFFIKSWEMEYSRIQKNPLPKFDLSVIKKPSDIIDQLSIIGISSIGGNSAFNLAIDRYKSIIKDKNKRPEFYSRIKRMVKNLNVLDLVKISDEIRELDEIIKTETNKARIINSQLL